MESLEGEDEERMVVMTTESEQKEVMDLLLGGPHVQVIIYCYYTKAFHIMKSWLKRPN